MVYIGSVFASIPFIPDSFWQLSATAKISRLCLVGMGVAGAAKGASWMNRQITDLKEEVSKLKRRAEQGEGKNRKLREELGTVAGRVNKLGKAQSEAKAVPDLPTLEAGYANCTEKQFGERLGAWEAVVAPESVRQLIRDQEKRKEFVQAVMKPAGVLIDQTAMTGWFKDSPAGRKRDLNKALTKWVEAVAQAEKLLPDAAIETVQQTLEILLQDTFPKLFALIDGKGNVDPLEVIQAYQRLPALLPAENADLDLGWLKDIAKAVKAGPKTLYLALKFGLPKLGNKQKTELKGIHKGQDPSQRKQLHACIDATIDLAVTWEKLGLAIAFEHRESRPGKIFWDGMVKLAMGRVAEEAGMRQMLQSEFTFLGGAEGQASTLHKTLTAAKAWYQETFQDQESRTATGLFNSLETKLTNSYNPLIAP